jgi:hypothetical protein
MKKNNKVQILKKKLSFCFSFITMLVLTISALTSCEEKIEDDIVKAGPLAVSASKTSVELNQKNAASEAFNLSWTTGTNNGTGASISYLLEIDLKGNNFSTALKYDMGKGVYVKSFNVAELNDSLLSHWKCTPNVEVELEARVTSTIYTTPTTNEVSPVIIISVTPYQPVSKTLYLVGNATSIGWDYSKALVMTPQSDPTVFVYQGALSAGSFKFITNLGQSLPSYNKGGNDNQIVYRTSENEPDDLFTITEDGVYKIVISLLDLTVSCNKVDLPPYSEIYIVGSATPIGWDITNAIQLTQDKDDPFIFTYQGVLLPGDFKFPVNRNSDWGQDMYMKLDDAHIYLHHGGDPDDSKWTIDKKGYYTVTLNLLDNTISIYKEKLYMVGSATPIGWNIGQAIEMTEDPPDGCIFTYNGPMLAGEFKFPVNRNSDWGQDMYMRIDDTHMYRHHGGDPDDNKWNINVDGNYLITVNIETLTISIVKQ